jgi:hypothetical protein
MGLLTQPALAGLMVSLGLLGPGCAFRMPFPSSSGRERGAVRMNVHDGNGPYKGPASFPLLDSVRYPHDMKQFNLKVSPALSRRPPERSRALTMAVVVLLTWGFRS